MAVKGRSRARNSGKNRVMATRIVPPNEGPRAGKVENMLAFFKESQGFTRCEVKQEFTVQSSTSILNGAWNFGNLVGTSDFTAYAPNFLKFKVACMKFDIYDINPGNNAIGVWGTYHGENYPTALNTVVDLPDGCIVAPGTGKVSLYWYPSGTDEIGWQNIAAYENFGGLAYNLPAASAGGPKFAVIATALVDFRARQ